MGCSCGRKTGATNRVENHTDEEGAAGASCDVLALEELLLHKTGAQGAAGRVGRREEAAGVARNTRTRVMRNLSPQGQGKK